MAHLTRIMYIEEKVDGIVGPARIGRVTYSKTASSLHYKGRRFNSLKGRGFRTNYCDAETLEQYWISGCGKMGPMLSTRPQSKSTTMSERNTGRKFGTSPNQRP